MFTFSQTLSECFYLGKVGIMRCAVGVTVNVAA